MKSNVLINSVNKISILQFNFSARREGNWTKIIPNCDYWNEWVENPVSQFQIELRRNCLEILILNINNIIQLKGEL